MRKSIEAAAAQLPALIQSRRPGHALPREFYTDPAIFECDMRSMLLKHWFCAGHVSSIARPGDYLVVDLGAESVIVARTPAGEVRACSMCAGTADRASVPVAPARQRPDASPARTMRGPTILTVIYWSRGSCPTRSGAPIWVSNPCRCESSKA